MHLWVHQSYHIIKGLAFAIDSRLLLVKVPHEAIFELSHQIRETEEEIRLEVLSGHDCLIAKFPEAIVQYGQNFIHTLHILDSFVKLCIDEEYARQCI